MNERKRGISLIVLVITILVMIILAGVVIVSLQKNNPVTKAKEATFKQDVGEFKSELNMTIANELFVNHRLKKGEINENKIEPELSKPGSKGIKKYIPSFLPKYEDVLVIKNGELVFVGDDPTLEKWTQDLNIPTGEKPVKPPKTFAAKYRFGDGIYAYFTRCASDRKSVPTYDVVVIKEGNGTAMNILDNINKYGVPASTNHTEYVVEGKLDLDSENQIWIDNMRIGNGISVIATAKDYGAIKGINNVYFSSSVTEIQKNALLCSAVYNLNFPAESKLKRIAGVFCDEYCGKNLVLPASIEEIGEGAFNWAYNLTTVNFKNTNLKVIGNNAFSSTNIKNVELPSTVLTIGDRAFKSCGATNITLQNGVKTIGREAFNGTSITTITIPNSVISIGDSAFYSCDSLNEIIIDKTNGSIQGEPWRADTNSEGSTKPIKITWKR